MAPCRPVCSVLWLLVASVLPLLVQGLHTDLVRRDSGQADAPSAEVQEQYVLRTLQWNVHGQCFAKCLVEGEDTSHCDHAYPACQSGALQLVTKLLQNESYDFIGLEMFIDRSLFTSTEGVMSGWTHLESTCGGAAGYGVYPFDVARLIFNSRRWEVVGDPRGGCMEKIAKTYKEVAADSKTITENNYRAFIVQALRRKGTTDMVTVAVAHFPHPERHDFANKINVLRDATARISAASKAPKTLLIADTNHGAPDTIRSISPLSSAQVARYLVEDLERAISTDLKADTCCFRREGGGYYGGSLDRIIAMNFTGASMKTELPFKGHVPFAAHDMHDPIVGVLTYGLAVPPRGLLVKTSSSRTAAAVAAAAVALCAAAALV